MANAPNKPLSSSNVVVGGENRTRLLDRDRRIGAERCCVVASASIDNDCCRPRDVVGCG